ncbi:MAG: PLP-dependent aminotransferase family protein [Christensenellaceae bacterium]|jgi:2-aminoadipate transaminase|nr:PLP-dependent aminotransferase family protein [Christensenellaceae bacterium]
MDYAFSARMRALRPSAIREIMKNFNSPDRIMLAGGNPAAESFPLKEIRELSAEILTDKANEIFQYGVSEGYVPLREAVLARLSGQFSLPQGAGNELVITSGSQQAVDLTCRAFLDENDVVLCEDPSYMGALNIFRSYNARLVGVRGSSDGLDPEHLEELLKTEKRVKLLYVIPNFQNPSGVTTSLEKRKAIYALCKKYGIVLIEDNPYGELRFKGEAIPPIKSFDDEGLVVYCGSFSKIFSAGIRIGFSFASPEISRRIALGKQVADVHTNSYAQVLLHAFMQKHDLDAHVRGIQGLYRQKAALMLEGVRANLPECSFVEPEGGLFVWVRSPREDAFPFCVLAAKRNVAIVPGSAFAVNPDAPSPSFRLNFSTPSDEQMERGLKILGECMKEFLKS